MLGLLLSLGNSFAQETHLRNSRWSGLNFARPDSQPCSPKWYSTTTADNCSNAGTGIALSGFVCDSNGKPLFSTDPSNSIIVPRPNHPDRYYIFCSSTAYDGLYYSEYDVTTRTYLNYKTHLNNLNGQPITSNIEGGGAVASMVHENGMDYWVLAYSKGSLMSYLITENGININPVSGMALTSSYRSGIFKIKICPKTNNHETLMAVLDLNTGVTIKGFNAGNGEIKNNYVDYSGNSARLIQKSAENLTNTIYTRSLEFSADGSIWYYIDSSGLYLLRPSGITVAPNNGYRTAQIGPDGNIYMTDSEGYLYRTETNNNNGFPVNTGMKPLGIRLGGQRHYLPPLVSFNKAMTPTIPTFGEVASVGANVNYALPTVSTNSTPIYGSWSPSTLQEGDNTYTFTPNSGQCAATVTKSYLLLKQTAVDAVDDDFSNIPIGTNGGQTPSVFNNDSLIFNSTANSDNVSVEMISADPIEFLNYVTPVVNFDGTITIGQNTYQGTVKITYKITTRACTSDSVNSDTATATLVLGSQNTSRKAQSQIQGTDKVMAYPNPSNGVFHIDLIGVQEEYDNVEVFNMLGAKVYENRLLSKGYNAIDLSNVTPGCYIAKISGKSGSQSLQLIKQ